MKFRHSKRRWKRCLLLTTRSCLHVCCTWEVSRTDVESRAGLSSSTDRKLWTARTSYTNPTANTDSQSYWSENVSNPSVKIIWMNAARDFYDVRIAFDCIIQNTSSQSWARILQMLLLHVWVLRLILTSIDFCLLNKIRLEIQYFSMSLKDIGGLNKKKTKRHVVQYIVGYIP